MKGYATLVPSTVEAGWWTGTFWTTIGDSDYEAGHVFKETREEAVLALSKLFESYCDVSIFEACECGGKKVGFKPFDAGHSHWCPVSGTPR
jgi:hypothetical protein